MIPQPFEARMMQYGYQQIKSEAQAAQLIRRELKGMAAQQQRRQDARIWNFNWLLRIKVGAWFMFYQYADGRRRKQLILMEELKEYPP